MAGTLGGLTNEQRTSYNRVLLARAKPHTPVFKDAKKGRIPTREGKVMQWRMLGGSPVSEADMMAKGSGLALATTPLVEATKPTETPFLVGKVEATVQQFGAYCIASDLLIHQSIDPLWAELFAALGEQAGQTFHTLLMNTIAGATGAVYAGAATSRSTLVVGDIIATVDITEAVRSLERAKAPKFPDGFYHGIMHPDVAYDLRNDTDFKQSMVYNGGVMSAGTNSLITNEIRDWRGVRFMVTTDAPRYAPAAPSTVSAYGTPIYGPGFFGSVDLEAQGMGSVSDDGVSGLRIRAVPVETETKDDPLGQFGTAGWKGTYGGAILQVWRGTRIESSATV